MGRADYVATGPLLDGIAAAEVPDAIREIVGDVAEEAQRDVEALGWSQWREPTGFYASNMLVDRVSDEAARVHDNEVIYGPWLEGVSERNRTTRFKGYATFRQTAQQVDAKADAIGLRALKRYLRRWGGT